MTILDLAKYDRYAVFLQGTFDVLPVAPGYSDVRIAATAGALRQAIPSTCTGPSYVHDDEVHNHMTNVIANRARARGLLLAHDASQNNINLSVPATAIHCECVLVAYHHHNPNADVSGYIGLSEPPCFACHAYLVAYNKIIPVEVPHRSRFYIKPSSRVVRFPWAAPILQPAADGDSLNQLVRECMIDMSLRPELCRYAEQVRDDISESKHAAERRALLVDIPTDGTSLYDIHSLIGMSYVQLLVLKPAPQMISSRQPRLMRIVKPLKKSANGWMKAAQYSMCSLIARCYISQVFVMSR